MIKRLLQLLTESIPPNENQRHNITLGDDCLVLTLMHGEAYQSVILEDADLKKSPTELADEITQMLEVKRVDPRS